MFRSALTTTVPLHSLSVPASRSLHASPASYKTVTEKVKDAAQTVNLKVGQTLAKGIEKGEETTEKVQETVGSKAKNAAEEAHNKVNQTQTGSKEAKEDLKRNLKG